ncbi:MAG: phosphate/phosphite/phosphonate ABC transporter substrate-binding protein [Candidatus Omnitrophica bacterium]|nr:phosphate/phosphite/phosphonate ABC transporter substrate-binding protein [Candidatus Omnitrophota bacterium]MBU1127948.1 phosphate/phosphite/phosphonate ABC transporter substrate-binding protein [Candidatus Omnitrophota bacterium]MBU1784927.1 phosphate/phosphite/phosphonate ABC transporter substrate-binding protein [Candidatus Omnitrophota bacterium]MBU1851718.1 phosphate/phosphite/phosphonate ABC transporter substrate-binding protein [Candidatus Omnitrophota bacterium]
MAKRLLVFGLLGVLFPGFSGYGKEEVKITTREEPIRIAVSAMISPRETFVYYKAMLNHIGKKLKRPVELVQRETYAEVNDLIEKGGIEIAFVCSGPYVEGKRKFGMELLAVPQVHGESVYYSYIIVHKGSPIKKFEELRGKKFGFTDPHSNTGCLVPKYELAKMGELPETFFSKYVFTKSHDKSIKAVAQNLVDGAAVDHLIWEYADATNPEFTSKTRVIKKLGPFGIPPVVVHPDYDLSAKEKIRKILLNMHKDEEGKYILEKIFIDRFTIAKDSEYDSVRKMQKWLREREIGI